ncbi:alpha-mannosidase [Chengkuizengella sediminis]|uniref:alpha-mannosidase n=1 Tax=Chengkuizengella sediminis TaxID=1885917 RepID=UPI001389A682|nr:alpha-mannosidase [Chengkuizengella sediminis]NDI35930.1 alpha-mannosidase [Chengkuizengella sediminis]
MFHTENKLEARIQELLTFRYQQKRGIFSFRCQEDEGEIGQYPLELTSNQTINVDDNWKGRDKYIWLQADVDIPHEWKGRKTVGLFDFGNTGGGNNSGFESLLFLNGRPYQGVDSNHQEVFFPEDAVGKTNRLDFRLWSGLEGGGLLKEQEHKIKTAQIAWLDEKVDDLYYTSLATLQTVKELSEDQPEKQLLLNTLNQTYLMIDWSLPGSESFYQSCYEAQANLNEKINQIEKQHPVTIHCIGHTHIDVAWLWRLKHTREKAARSFSTVLRLMEQYPEYVFLQTQPQLYEYIKEDYPEIYDQMKTRIKEGKWEPEGAMWLEADCNVTSGESLVRQILYGKRFFEREFGVTCKYLWLPDVFGYSWALPQILCKSGIETFMTTKISWNQYNRMPHDTFHWKGIDGSEILTHFITTPEPWNSDDSWFYTYNGLVSAKTVKGLWKSYQNKDVNQDLLLSYGYGDGGGGVNRDMLELRRRLDRMPGLPQVKPTKAGEFFDKLHQNIENTEGYVHTWDGELYLEYHRGTYTSQAHNKKMNRKLELAYREAEWLNVMNALSRGWNEYPQAELDEGWKIILRNQFHDIIPGSSIKEVYEDSKVEYEQSWDLHRSISNKALAGLIDSSVQQYTVMNASHWQQGELVQVTYDEVNQQDGNWRDQEGNHLISQRSEHGWYVQVLGLKGFSGTEILFEPHSNKHQTESVSLFDYTDSSINTPFYKIKWNKSGQIVQIYDKVAERQVFANREKGNILQVFEDKPLAHDAWDIDIFYKEKMEEVTELTSVELVECGLLRAVIRFNWTYLQSTMSQDMIVYTRSKRIDFSTNVDWHQQRKLLKVAFPVDVRTTEATYDIQYGNVKRPNHQNTSWDMARFESVGHMWADLSETGYGVSLLNDCKYGYDIMDNIMRLTLIKSATHPDPTADQGEHQFTYSLLPHQGDWRQAETVREAWVLNEPLQAIKGTLTAPFSSFLNLSCHHVHIDAIKKAENDHAVIVRLHEFEGRRAEVTITSDWGIEEWQEVDLMEQPISDIFKGNSINCSIKPYEIKTFAIKFLRR